MSDREAFVQAIAANPADDLPRLVFADWLEEHGEPERAEFIRTQIRWHRTNAVERKQLDQRAAVLFRDHWTRWLGPFLLSLDPTAEVTRNFHHHASQSPAEQIFCIPLSATHSGSPFVPVTVTRGFVSVFGADLAHWPERASLAEAFRHEPVTHLHCRDGLHSPRWARFTDPTLRRVRRLSVRQLWAWGVSAPESTALLEDPHLAGVRQFTLHPVGNDGAESHPLPAPWVTRFVRSSLAYRLTDLCFLHLGDDAVPALCKPGRLHLERLTLSGPLGVDSVRQLGGSDFSETVGELTLSAASLGNAGVAALARDRWRKLSRLGLQRNNLSAAVLPALATAEFVPRLKELDLSGNPLFTGDERDMTRLEQLAESLDRDQLERLDLTDTGLSHVPDFLTERFGDRATL